MDEVLERLSAAVDDLLQRPVWAASTAEQVAVVINAQVAIDRLTLVQAASVRELNATGYPAQQGATNVRVWLRDRLKISIHAASRLVNLGEQAAERPAIVDAITTGTVGVEQAAVIAAALADVPTDIEATVVDGCESALIEHAARWEPAALRRISDRILAHVAPELADEALRRKLEHDEAHAHTLRSFTMTDHGNGIVRLTGCLEAEAAATVKAAIDPLGKPAPTDGVARDLRLPAQRRADALVEACRLALASSDLPVSGGARPQVTVTMDLDTLTRQVRSGVLDTGHQLTAAAVRRLACDAAIIPAILGSDSEVLDLGRSRRSFTGPLRRALVLRDRGCAFPACDRPPHWCDGHHVVHWLDGGDTCLTNGVLLCRRHHRAVHHDGWNVRIADDGTPEFIPPTYVDPLQRPQRNRYHLRR